NTILSTILDSKVGERGYAYIVSANGWLIAHPKVKQTTSEFTVYDYSSYAPVAAVMKGQEGFVEYEYDGELWLAAYHPIKSTGWGVVVQQPKTDVMKSVNEESYLYVFAALAIALLAVVTLPFVLVYALQPLSRLVDTIKRRNFPVQDTFSHDEIGQLAAEFSTLYSDLIESEQNLKRLNEELEERVNERTVHLMEAREEIQKKEAHYRSVFQHSNDGIIIHDREGVIKDANYRAIELFGYARDEVLSLTIDLLFSPPASDGFTQELERALNEKHIIFESELLKKDGTVFSGERCILKCAPA
nr:PAS domain S-box protein [Desulfobacterales bacterium]